MYNPPPKSRSIRILSEQLQAACKALEIEGFQILLGNLNLHHPAWGGANSARYHLASDLLEATEKAGLSLLLPKSTIIRKLMVNEGTGFERVQQITIDLIFESQEVVRRVVSCGIRENLATDFDHLSIETRLAVGARIDKNAISRAWKRMDTEAFQTRLQEGTTNLPGLNLETKTQIDAYTARLIEKIRKIAIATASEVKSSSYDKAFWTEKCKKAIQAVSHLRWKAYKTQDPETDREAKRAVYYKGKVIRNAKTAFFRNSIESLAEDPRKF